MTSAEEAPPQTLLGLVLPVLAGSVVHAVETVCYFPAVSAVALCCYSMVEPSVFSAGVQTFPSPPVPNTVPQVA